MDEISLSEEEQVDDHDHVASMRRPSQCLRVKSTRKSTVYSCTMRHESWTITFPKELV